MVQLGLLQQEDGRRGEGLGGGGDGQEIQGEAHEIPMKITIAVRLENTSKILYNLFREFCLLDDIYKIQDLVFSVKLQLLNCI